MRKSLMIFAAGFGKRMAPLTNTIPKPLVRIGNTTLIDHTLNLAQAAKFETIVINTHYLSEKLQSHLEFANVHFAYEPTILETGGGLKAAAHLFNEDAVVTTNSDAVWSGSNPFDALPSTLGNADAILLCAHKDQVQGRTGPGDFEIGPDNQISRGGDYVFLGIQLIRLSCVSAHNEDIFSLNTIWDELIKKIAFKVYYIMGNGVMLVALRISKQPKES